MTDGCHPLPTGLASLLGDRYEVLGVLGEGGFGQVFQARQQATGQEVAIKVLRLRRHPGAVDPAKQIARFRRELALCARLYHPHIVRPLDSGQGEDDLIYTVFEFVPGRNLAELIAAEGALAPPEAIRLMAQVLDALHCAHQAGVIHRDLKPENIMITRTGARPNALVLDFGIGALTEDGEDQPGRLTEPHESLGSPAYAAPEQLRGVPVTPVTDFYAWGLVFLECLQGGAAIGGASLSEVLYRQLGPEPVPVPVSLRDTPLGQLLSRVTAKEPAERPDSAPALLAELDEIALQWRLAERLPSPIGKARLMTSSMPVPMREVVAALGGSAEAGERRQLTALCCEMVLESCHGEDLEMEELDALLREQRQLCLRIVDNNHGYLAGVLGDRVLVYFGYPRAREDDPQRAARCALDLASGLAERSRTLVDARGVECRFGIGLHTGLVVVPAEADGGVDLSLGQTPELSSRLAGLAPRGGALLSEATEALLGGQFACESVGEQRLPGLSRPLRVWRLMAASGEVGAGTGRPAIPLVGRESELSLLGQVWTQAQHGEGQAVLLVGEPGVGKSRLVETARQQLWSPASGWLECRCAFENRDRPLRPVVELLEQWLRQVGERDLRTLEAQLARYQFSLEDTVPVLAELLDLPIGERYPTLSLSAERRRELTEETLLSLFCELAEAGALVMFFEDLHWADPSTLALLEKLLEDVPSVAMLVLCTARPEFTPPWPAGRVRQLHLEGLGDGEVEAMVQAISGARTVSAQVLAMIAERTDGVALFVEELTLLLLENGALEVHDGALALARPLAELMIPDSLRGLLTARLDRLGAARETAQLAAAIGREFAFDLLAAVSPRPSETLDRDLAALVAADLVYRRRRHRHPAYVFRHALIRDNAYQSMLQATRQQVHRQIAAAIEQRLPALATSRPELLAYHHAEGGELQQALGYAEQASQGALARSAYREALQQADRALGWLSVLADPVVRAAQELRLNGIATPAVMALEGYISPRLAALTRRSQALIDQLGDVPQAFPTLWAVATYHHVRAERREARQLAERLVGLAQRTAEQNQWLAAQTHLGQCLLVEGRFGEAEQLLLGIIDDYPRSLDPGEALRYGLDALAYMRMTLSRVRAAQGRLEDSLQEAHQAVIRSREIHHANSEALALLYLMNAHQQRAETAEVARVGAETVAFCETHGLGFVRSLAALVLACGAGELSIARDIADRHEAHMVRLGLTYYRGLVAETALRQGEIDVGLALVERSLAEVQRTGERYYLATLLSLKGQLLAARGDRLAGLDWCRQGLTVAGEQQADGFRLRIATALVALQADDPQAPERALLGSLLEAQAGSDCPVLSAARDVLAR